MPSRVDQVVFGPPGAGRHEGPVRLNRHCTGCDVKWHGPLDTCWCCGQEGTHV